MRLNIAIVDDSPEDSARLESFIRGWFTEDSGRPELGCVRRYGSGEEFLGDFEAGSFHLVFMDIIMAGLNGIDTARKLRESDQRVLIAFITTSREYAFEAFPVHPFDYIVKPYGRKDAGRVLSEAVRALCMEEPTVTIRVPYGSRKVPSSLIISAVARDHYVEVRLYGGESLMAKMKFREVEQMLLENDGFISCNRGVIVNMSKVSAIEGGVFVMKDGSRYPIRQSSLREITAAFSQHIISGMRSRISNSTYWGGGGNYCGIPTLSYRAVYNHS